MPSNACNFYNIRIGVNLHDGSAGFRKVRSYKGCLMTSRIMLALHRKTCLTSLDRHVKQLPPINVLVVTFLHHTIVTRGTGYEPLQVSKTIRKVLQFMLKVLRPCNVFWFTFAHYG